MICAICSIELKNFKALVGHLRYKHNNLSSKEYYDTHFKKESDGVCAFCEKTTNFISVSRGYNGHCSKKCIAKSLKTKEKTKKTWLKNYGVDNPAKSSIIKDRMKQTNLKKYGVENPNQCASVKKKKKETCNKKYGTDTPAQNKDVQQKILKKFQDKYGDHPFKIKEFRQKIENTMLKKYGNSCSWKSRIVKEKIKQINLKKYGVDSPAKSEIIKNKMKKTNIDRYGMDNPSQVEKFKQKRNKVFLKKYGKHPLKTTEVRNKIKATIFKKRLPQVLELLASVGLKMIDPYTTSKNFIKLKCLICNTVFETCTEYVQQGNGKCPVCYPKRCSIAETDIKNFIKLLGFEIVENSFKIIPPYELDIYIPDKKIAIEYDSFYYHNEKEKDKKYHLMKTERCLEKGIHLIHIFEDEWYKKEEIVKNTVKQLLNVSTSKKIHARKCFIKYITTTIKDSFLNTYHLMGIEKTPIRLGAFYEEELVAVMTFSRGNRARGSKCVPGHFELTRFCSNYNYRVVGIASKLLKYFQRNYEWEEIYTYADRRWSVGNLYYKLGFTLKHSTKPNYWYIDKEGNRIYRFNLRKKRNDPKDITESILRAKEGYTRIWDCGVLKFVLYND